MENTVLRWDTSMRAKPTRFPSTRLPPPPPDRASAHQQGPGQPGGRLGDRLGGERRDANPLAVLLAHGAVVGAPRVDLDPETRRGIDPGDRVEVGDRELEVGIPTRRVEGQEPRVSVHRAAVVVLDPGVDPLVAGDGEVV